MEKFLHEQFGDMLLEYQNGGYMVRPVEQGELDCGTCGGSCG